MTRRWFLKLLTAIASWFGVKVKVEAEPIKRTCTGVERKWEIAAPSAVEPEVNELLARCRVPGTLTAAVLNAGHIVRVPSSVGMGGEFESINEPRDGKVWTTDNGVTYTLHALPLPKLDTAEKVEAATLGIGDPCKGLYGVFNHPNAMRHKITSDERLVCHVLKMRHLLLEKRFCGPFAFVYPEKWNWNGEYSSVERVMKAEGISCVVPVKALNGTNKIALVQLTPDVIQMIVCHDRIVPRIRSNMFGNCGIVIAEET